MVTMTNVEITLTMSARQFQFLRTELQNVDTDLRQQMKDMAPKSDLDQVAFHQLRARLAQLQELLVELGS